MTRATRNSSSKMVSDMSDFKMAFTWSPCRARAPVVARARAPVVAPVGACPLDGARSALERPTRGARMGTRGAPCGRARRLPRCHAGHGLARVWHTGRQARGATRASACDRRCDATHTSRHAGSGMRQMSESPRYATIVRNARFGLWITSGESDISRIGQTGQDRKSTQ
jgi:hypothetical protein